MLSYTILAFAPLRSSHNDKVIFDPFVTSGFRRYCNKPEICFFVMIIRILNILIRHFSLYMVLKRGTLLLWLWEGSLTDFCKGILTLANAVPECFVDSPQQVPRKFNERTDELYLLNTDSLGDKVYSLCISRPNYRKCKNTFNYMTLYGSCFTFGMTYNGPVMHSLWLLPKQ